VLAIGHPLGMGTTLTHGIVSALGRQAQVIEAEYRIESFIQTNAVINPGNSGGPLLDLQGRVIGVNTAISTKTGYFMGYGLAVPIDLAREAMDDFLIHGRVVRGYLGISMEDVDDELVRQHGLQLSPPRGVYVKGIDSGTPADRSGLSVGDVMLAIDGQPVDLANEVQTRIYSRDPGDGVELTVVRDGEQQLIRVVLGEREEDRLLVRGQRRIELLGLTVGSIDNARAQRLGFTDEIARELRLEEVRRAVVITAVEPDSPAAELGLQVDDVITEIDQTTVLSVDQFVRDLANLEDGTSALFWLWRQGHGVDVRALPIRAVEAERP
jgi:serine protease Do